MAPRNVRTLLVLFAALALAAFCSCRQNRAPDVPDAPAGPGFCFKDTTYTFVTAAADPDGDSVAVRFDWGDTTPSYWMGWFASGDTVAMTHAWQDTGTYEVHAWAQDRKLLTSDSSGGLVVRVGLRRPPNTPAEPTGPGYGGQDSSYAFTTRAFHPDGIKVSVRFAWGDGDTSNWGPFLPSGSPVKRSHAWSAPGTYAVTAQARDTGSALSGWSAPHGISIASGGGSGLRMVGRPILSVDSSGFRIDIVNTGMTDITTGWLWCSDTNPDDAWMRTFMINGNLGVGYPKPPAEPATGPGDTVFFASPVTISPDMSEMVELIFLDFYPTEYGLGQRANVHDKVFRFRFDDGSEILVQP
jgi:hypothetical protein